MGIGWFNVEKFGQKALDRLSEKEKALDFFMRLFNCGIKKVCIENPRGFAMKIIKPTQMIHPYFFGDSEKKMTCLWLKGLPPLVHSPIKTLFEEKSHSPEPKPKMITKSGKEINWSDSFSPSKYRQKLRSKTFQGIANAMAEQWG